MTEQPEEPGNRRKALARFRPSLDTAERDAEAARMYYSERVTWQEVADRLGFANKGSAKHAADRAMDAARARPTRQMIGELTAEIKGESDLLAGVIFGSAQYRTSVTGKLLLDSDGEPMEDLSSKLDAIAKRTKLRDQLMSLHGLAAAKKYASIHASVELDSENETLQSQVAEAYQVVLEEKDRELAGLRAQLAAAPAPGADGPAGEGRAAVTSIVFRPLPGCVLTCLCAPLHPLETEIPPPRLRWHRPSRR